MEESQVSPVNDLNCHFLVLPYQGHNGGFLIKSIKKSLKTLLPDNVKTDLAFQGKQVSCCFNIKDKTEFRHKHHLVYHAKCTEESCNDDYSDKTARRISEKMLGHSGRDKNSHVLKQQLKKNTLVQNTTILKLLVVTSAITLKLKKNTLVQNTTILKLLVVTSVITLKRENYQKRCGLTLLDFP